MLVVTPYARPDGPLRDLARWRGSWRVTCWRCGPALLFVPGPRRALDQAAPPGGPDEIQAWMQALLAEIWTL